MCTPPILASRLTGLAGALPILAVVLASVRLAGFSALPTVLILAGGLPTAGPIARLLRRFRRFN